jgi:osmotically inducible lipoprotein OsmB
MERTLKTGLSIAAIVALTALTSACHNWSNRDTGTAVGAVAGGVAGNMLTGGSAGGTLIGAGAGAVVGHEVSH